MAARIKLNSLADLGKVLPAAPEPAPLAEKPAPEKAAPKKPVGVLTPPLSIPVAKAYSHVIKAELKAKRASIADLVKAYWDITPSHSVWKLRKANMEAFVSGKIEPDAEHRARLEQLFATDWKKPQPVLVEALPQEVVAVEEPSNLSRETAQGPTGQEVNFLRLQLRLANVEIFQDPENGKLNIIVGQLDQSNLPQLLALFT